MSREIKFRAWNSVHKRMIFGPTDGGHHSSSWVLALCEGQPEIPLMQFTGLRDKRGKDVYEGDIVIYKVCGDPEKTMEVKFIDGSFVAGPDQYNDYRTMHTEEMEVIGNIYENPELLTPEAPTK